MHAARGTTLRRLGQRDAAKAAFERAAQLAATEADRRFHAQQIEELAEDGALRQEWHSCFLSDATVARRL
jgi:predicted RNA polymerase sigma factor